jgi:two-component system phosphate regulon sensor histidine kinase PhoR
MKKISIRLLVAVMSLALLTVVLVQWFWISNALTVRQEQFANRVYGVLDEVVNRIEERNYAKFISNINDELTSKNLIDDTAYKAYSSTIVDSLMYGSGFYRFNNEGTYVPKNNKHRMDIRPYNEYYSMFKDVSKMRTTEMIFSQVVESATNKLNLSKMKSLEELEKSKKSLEKFIIKIFREADISKLSTEDRLRDINVYNIVQNYLRYAGIELRFSIELSDSEAAEAFKRGVDADDYFVINPFPDDWSQKKNMLVLHFMNRKNYLYSSIMWLLISSAVCISILMAVFAYTVFVIIRQRKLSEVKNDFINNMTHEFKTPIATISLATSAINNPKVINNPEQIRKFNAMIRKENERMHKHVEKILHQASLDRKEIDLNIDEIHLNELINEACEHFSLQCEENCVNLVCKPEANLDIIYGDEMHITNCIINMIDNSIKYSKLDPKIVVYTKSSSKGVIVGVRDNGLGLTREAQKMIFTRFYRVTHGNLHNIKGFGLGLSYVKSIVEAHKGTISLKSKINKGTSIELFFPNKK